MSATDVFQFHLEEFKRLSSQISDLSAERRRLDQLAILSTGGIFSWLAVTVVHPDTLRLISYAWWLPSTFAIFGLLRHEGITASIDRNAEYIARIEHLYAHQGLLGWESSMKAVTEQAAVSHNKKARLRNIDVILFRKYWTRPQRLTARVFWILLLGFDIWVAVSQTYRDFRPSMGFSAS
jgi:hypothetical protein